jgi:hypothetical protein
MPLSEHQHCIKNAKLIGIYITMQTCIQKVNVSNLGPVQAFLACQAMKQ